MVALPLKGDCERWAWRQGVRGSVDTGDEAVFSLNPRFYRRQNGALPPKRNAPFQAGTWPYAQNLAVIGHYLQKGLAQLGIRDPLRAFLQQRHHLGGKRGRARVMCGKEQR